MLCVLRPPRAWQKGFPSRTITLFAPKVDPAPAFHCFVVVFLFFYELIDVVNTKQEKRRASTSSLHSIHSHH